MEERYSTGSAGLLLGKFGLLILFGGFLLAAWNGLIVITIILGMAVAASGLTLLWSCWCLKGVACKRELSESRVFPGDDVELKMQLINRKLLPMPWVQVDQYIPVELNPGAENLDIYPGYSLLSRSSSLSWYSKLRWSAVLHSTKRGYYPLRGMEITSGDIFGFHTRSMVVSEPANIIVYPKLIPIEKQGVPSSYPLGSANADRMIFEDPLRIMGVRDYSPGDSMKKIHWKASARKNSPQVKVLEPTTTIEAVVFLSLDSYLEEGIKDDQFEYGISFAASLAKYLMGKGNPVGLFVNSKLADSAKAARVYPGNTPRQLVNILETLAKVTRNTTGSFDQFLNDEYRTLPWGTTVIIVLFSLTDLLKQNLTRIKNSGYRVMAYQTGGLKIDSFKSVFNDKADQ